MAISNPQELSQKSPLLLMRSFLLVAVPGAAAVFAVWSLVPDPTHRWLAIIALLLFSHVFFLFVKWQASKPKKPNDKILSLDSENKNVEKPPEPNDRNERIEFKLHETIKKLKRTKVENGRWKRKALYALPKYLCLGPTGSGKSSLLRHSELNFTNLDPSLPSDPKLQGIGGTSDCDFWYSDKAIFLDTAGRYMNPKPEAETRAEWLTILQSLKKIWRLVKINGVILTISLADENESSFSLLDANEEEIEHYAKDLRLRIDELMTILKLRVPIYLVFNKCDLLHGFIEYFEELKFAEKYQVWGCTLNNSQLENSQPHLFFHHEFNELYNVLERKRLLALGAGKKPHHKRVIFGFPLEFAAAYKKLERFIKALMEPNLYQEKPLFRGFYFSSVRQEGSARSRVIDKLTEKFGIPDQPVTESKDDWKGQATYFIKDLINKIIIPDLSLAGPLERIRRRRLLVADLSFGLLAVFVFLILVLYLNN